MKPIINYKEHSKLRIIGDESRIRHEVVKCITMLLLKVKHKDCGIYSEYELKNGDRADVMIDFGDYRVLFEIQENTSPMWLQSIKNRDLELGMNTIIIPLKDLSNNINRLTEQLKEYLI